jgi:protein-tyrosine-phosphatase
MPASIIAPLTRQVMSERGVDLGDQFPKPIEWVGPETFDLVVNLTDLSLPDGITSPVRVCKVRDPIGSGARVYRQVRDDIERLVLDLLNEVRTGAAPAP